MGRIVVTEHVSPDGVIEGPGGGEDHKHGGWTFDFDRWSNTGKRLFGDTADSKRMRLVESRTVGDGLTILILRPAASSEMQP